jgi:hypothetical protein
MRQYFLSYLGVFFIYLKTDNSILRLKLALAQSDSRVSAVCTDLQHFSYFIFRNYLLYNFSFLRTKVHHPSHKTVLINKFQCFLRVILRTVFQNITLQKILNILWTLSR